MAAAPVHQSDIAAHEHMLDTEAWNDNVEKTVDLLWDTLVTHLGVNVPHLLVFLRLKEVDKIAHRLHELARKDRNKEAAAELLSAIKRSDEPDKWRVFVNELKKASGEDSILLHYLLSTDSTDEWLDHPEHRKLMNLMKECLYDHLKMKALMPKMIEKGLISEDHAQKILAKEKKGERGYAQLELIAAMQSYQVNWYRKFITILYEDDHHRNLAMEFDPEFCKEKLEQLTSEKKTDVESTQEQTAGSSSADGNHQEHHSTSASSSRAGSDNDDPEQGVSHSAEDQPQAGGHREASCQCRCCAKLGVEVSSLRSTVLSLSSEISEIKQLLLERGQRGS